MRKRPTKAPATKPQTRTLVSETFNEPRTTVTQDYALEPAEKCGSDVLQQRVESVEAANEEWAMKMAAVDPLYGIPNLGRALVMNEWQRRDNYQSPWLGVQQLRPDRSDGPDLWSVASTDDLIILTLEKNSYPKQVGLQEYRTAEGNLAMGIRMLKMLEDDPNYLDPNSKYNRVEHARKIEDAKDDIEYQKQTMEEAQAKIDSFDKQQWNFDRVTLERK